MSLKTNKVTKGVLTQKTENAHCSRKQYINMIYSSFTLKFYVKCVSHRKSTLEIRSILKFTWFTKKVNIQQRNDYFRLTSAGYLMDKDTDNKVATQSSSPQKRQAVKMRCCSIRM